MSSGSVEKKALSLLTTLENSGRTVSRVVVEGRKIEIVLASGNAIDEYEKIDMRHDKA